MFFAQDRNNLFYTKLKWKTSKNYMLNWYLEKTKFCKCTLYVVQPSHMKHLSLL